MAEPSASHPGSLPDRDFDTTESSVVWDALDPAGHEVVFATENGAAAECDRHLLGPGWHNTFPAEPAVVARIAA
jgi:hypothetical protein